MTSLQICTQGASKQVETWWGVVWRGLHGPGRPRLPGPAPRSSSCALLRFADVEGLGRPCVWQVCRRRVPQRVLAGLPESCSVLLTTVQTSPAIGDLGVACVMVSGRDELHPRALANLPGECAWGPCHAGPAPASRLREGRDGPMSSQVPPPSAPGIRGHIHVAPPFVAGRISVFIQITLRRGICLF